MAIQLTRTNDGYWNVNRDGRYWDGFTLTDEELRDLVRAASREGIEVWH